MRFVFNLHNHNDIGKMSLIDPMNNIAKQLEDLGHSVEWCDNYMIIEDGAYNVIFDGFREDKTQSWEKFHKAGGKFIIIATEEPTGNTFNHGAIKHMKYRAAGFEKVGPMASAIWYLVPGCEWYHQFAPATFLDLGYSPRLERRPDVPIEYDIGFFGSVTKRRAEILKRFVQYGLRVHIPAFAESEKRDLEIAKCKVILQLRSYEEMSLISSSRCSTGLHLGKPVLAEPHGNPGAWSEIIRFEELEWLPYIASKMCEDWRYEHEKQMTKFKELLPAEKTVGKALELLH